MKATAVRATDEHGKVWDLVYDTDDIEAAETPVDIRDVTRPEDTATRRELGQFHLHLHFREGKRPRWVAAELDDGPAAELAGWGYLRRLSQSTVDQTLTSDNRGLSGVRP